MRSIPSGIVGQAYAASDPDQDAQELINWFVEKSTDDKSKEPGALLAAPGLLKVAQGSGECRGAWSLPGGKQCLWVTGSVVYLMTVATNAGTSPATFTLTQVGTTNSVSGPVSIRDNGTVAVLVDGTQAGYVYNIATSAYKQIVDPGFYGSDRVSFIDGWFVFNRPGTQQFYTSPLYWNGTTAFSASYFASKDSSTDLLVTHIESLRELWLMGERTTEVWYDAGNANFPFSRLQGVSLQIGCSAAHSLCRFGKGLIWLAKSERGENVVVQSEGYQYEAITSPAVSKAIGSYAKVSDAIGYTYAEDGHSFYVLTFPTADVTWVYDAQTHEWHKRASFDPTTGLFHRQRGNCFVNFQDQRLVGDYSNGQIYRYSRSIYTDGDYPLVSLRRSPHIWDGGRERLFHAQLQIQFRAGVGLATEQGSAPLAMLRWSDDSGFTWSNYYTASVGLIGETKNRAIWRRLGQSRDRIYEVSMSDPVARDIVGATLWIDA